MRAMSITPPPFAMLFWMRAVKKRACSGLKNVFARMVRLHTLWTLGLHGSVHSKSLAIPDVRLQPLQKVWQSIKIRPVFLLLWSLFRRAWAGGMKLKLFCHGWG